MIRAQNKFRHTNALSIWFLIISVFGFLIGPDIIAGGPADIDSCDSGVTWVRSPCGADGYYVVYDHVFPWRQSIKEYYDTSATRPLEFGQYCAYGAGIDIYRPYEGAWKPEAVYFGVSLFTADSAAAAQLADSLPGGELDTDIDEYEDSLWKYEPNQHFYKNEIDSLVVHIRDWGIKLDHYEVFDDNALIFFGSCLSNNEADMIKRRLDSLDIPTRVVKYEYIEPDI